MFHDGTLNDPKIHNGYPQTKMRESKASNGENKAPVVAVYKRHEPGNTDNNIDDHKEEVEAALRYFLAGKYPVLLCEVDIPVCNEEKKKCIEYRKIDEGVCTIYDDSRNPVLGDYADHSICEYDDVLLSYIYKQMSEYAYKVTVVSMDAHVVKRDDVVSSVDAAVAKLGSAATVTLQCREQPPPERRTTRPPVAVGI